MRKLILYTTNTIYTIGEFIVFSFQSFVFLFKPPYRIKNILEQLVTLGLSSISIIGISSIAVGMIFTLQLSVELQKLGIPTMAGNIIGQVFTREFSPVFTSLILIGKNGSSITAELGAMKLGNQIHAMNIMLVNPIHYLVTPRLIAFIFVFPILSAMSSLIGLGGAALIAFGLLNIDYAATINYMFLRLTEWDIITGIFKSFLFGFFICLICCFLGMQEKQKSKDIATSTTKAVVYSSLMVLIVDFFLGKLFISWGLIA